MNGSLLATAPNGGAFSFSFWVVKDGKQQTMGASRDFSANSLAFHPKGKLLAVAGNDDTVKLWSIDSGKEAFDLGGHPGRWVRFHAEGRLLLTRDDRSLKIWKMDGPRAIHLGTAYSFYDGTWAVTDPEERRYDASDGGNLPHAHWVTGNNVDPLERHKEDLREEGLLARILKKVPKQ
jgi:WD40 repeat protein